MARIVSGALDLASASTYGRRMNSKICSLFLALAAFTLPVLAGEASGSFKSGTRPPIRPKYAAAYETPDQRDARKMSVEVVLSEEPIDIAEAIAELDPHANVINQKALRDHNYILLWVRPDNDVSMNATYSETMTQFMEMTGSRMKAELTVNTPGKVAGHIYSPKPLKSMDGSPYTIDLTFSTEVTRPPAGTKLPADGGEPGKALRALQAAIANKSSDGLSKTLTAKNQESFSESYRSPQENLDYALQTLAFWLPKKPGKITGGELRGNSAVLHLEGELFEGQNGLYLIRMVKEGQSWVFDRAVKAGMIDK
jgi:hypothetical protein